MKIQMCKTSVKCDIYKCKNMAKYSITTKGFLKHEFVFCEDCMKKMFECFSKEMVPKSINAPYKRLFKEGK